MMETISSLFWKLGIPCVFHLLTGAYCPGCGGTRAAKALLTGHILTSLRYNPMVCYAAAVFVGFGLWKLWVRFRGRPAPSVYRLNPFLYGGAALALVNWIFKNYMLLVKGVDLLA